MARDRNNIFDNVSDNAALLESTTSKYGTLALPERRSDRRNRPTERKSGLYGLFRYASTWDRVLMLTGIIFAILHGASFPVLAIVFGNMTNIFILQASASNQSPSELPFGSDNGLPSRTTDIIRTGISNASSKSSFVLKTEAHPHASLSAEEFSSYMSMFSLYYFFIGVGVMVAAFVQVLCWELACERQVYRLRQNFFTQLLRQDISWYDQNGGRDFTTKLSDDLERVREGIGSKFCIVVQYASTFISGLSVGFYANWRLTLAILAVGPIMIGTSAYFARVASSSAAREQLKYSIAGGIAEEVLNCIQTVAAFGGQDREIKRYEAALEEGRWLAMKKYYALSAGMGFVFFVTYASYGFAFWYGSELIGAGIVTPGNVFTVFFSVMAGAFSLGNALPFINAVATAIGAASTVFEIIDRVPDIDPYEHKGAKPLKVRGHIQLKDVEFAYPARPDVKVLKGLSLDIERGKTVALVGSSGAGKSTIVGLLLRFYDVLQGRVMIDGINVRHLNLGWLRSQIGLVSQEPNLFETTIFENIRHGRENITMDDVVRASMMSNAHGFISTLPEGYNTMVGSGGAQLSGGQKQRIAIARALVRDPCILLLDEATSALDANSEGAVQAALDKAMKGRTTIIIAHRLSTVRNADIIYALNDGNIVESGTHLDLMKREGLYHHLVMTQTCEADANDECTHTGTEAIRSGNELESSLPEKRQRHRSISLSRASLHDIEHCRLLSEVEEIEPREGNVTKLFKLNSPEWGWLLAGFIGCALTGSVMPVFAYFYGEVFATFTLTGDELRKTALFWTYMFLVLAVVAGSSFLLQIASMSTAAEKLVMRVRLLAFANILRQSIGWFDLEAFSAGRLINRLARDAPLIKSAAGLRAGQVIGAVVTLVVALVIAFIAGWKLALLLVVAIPFLAGAAYNQMMLLRKGQQRDMELMTNAGKVASESVMKVRTVQALGQERFFSEQYMGYLTAPFMEAKKQALIYSTVFAFSQAVVYMMYAGAFRFGAYLIQINDMEPTDVYRVFFALAFCASSVGQTSAYLQDYTKAKMAADLMFQLIDQKPDIVCSPTEGLKPIVRGKVTFKDVHFRYPARPDAEVLRGLSFEIREGKTLALVGASGCGKSTTVALLERFYDPESGAVFVDNQDIRMFNLPYLRSHIGLVTQEPVLFNCSIRDNIAYGAVFAPTQASSRIQSDDLSSVSMTDIIHAARAANIHDFIVSLPQGYDTTVGERGTQLSGGQKQRIAIARALIRDPKILLLDEATSALDSESEKMVQEALDRARSGRTCIVIAHRLSTVHNADCIAVIHKGKVLECGSPDELMNLRGSYYQLIKRQRL